MRGIAIALAAALAAASGVATGRADPADSSARTEPLRFESGLRVSKARPDADPAARWREHNERVRAIGGHAGASRDTNRQAAPAKPPAGAEAGKL